MCCCLSADVGFSSTPDVQVTLLVRIHVWLSSASGALLRWGRDRPRRHGTCCRHLGSRCRLGWWGGWQTTGCITCRTSRRLHDPAPASSGERAFGAQWSRGRHVVVGGSVWATLRSRPATSFCRSASAGATILELGVADEAPRSGACRRRRRHSLLDGFLIGPAPTC